METYSCINMYNLIIALFVLIKLYLPLNLNSDYTFVFFCFRYSPELNFTYATNNFIIYKSGSTYEKFITNNILFINYSNVIIGQWSCC